MDVHMGDAGHGHKRHHGEIKVKEEKKDKKGDAGGGDGFSAADTEHLVHKEVLHVYDFSVTIPTANRSQNDVALSGFAPTNPLIITSALNGADWTGDFTRQWARLQFAFDKYKFWRWTKIVMKYMPRLLRGAGHISANNAAPTENWTFVPDLDAQDFQYNNRIGKLLGNGGMKTSIVMLDERNFPGTVWPTTINKLSETGNNFKMAMGNSIIWDVCEPKTVAFTPFTDLVVTDANYPINNELASTLEYGAEWFPTRYKNSVGITVRDTGHRFDGNGFWYYNPAGFGNTSIGAGEQNLKVGLFHVEYHLEFKGILGGSNITMAGPGIDTVEHCNTVEEQNAYGIRCETAQTKDRLAEPPLQLNPTQQALKEVVDNHIAMRDLDREFQIVNTLNNNATNNVNVASKTIKPTKKG